MGRRLRFSDLVTAAEIAERLGVQRSTVSNWRARPLGFPEPIFRLNYRWPDVVAWLLTTGRITGNESFLQRYPAHPSSIDLVVK